MMSTAARGCVPGSDVLRVDSLSHDYRERSALTDVSFDLSDKVTALIGVNGAGKTTLLSCLSGALRPTRGDVIVAGQPIYQRRSRSQALRSVALMPQSFVFPGNLTALEAVTYIGWMRGLRSSAAGRAATTALETVGLSDRARSKMKSLSGGMQRRVALAQAIVTKPDLLLLDEPSTGLDPRQRRSMVELLGRLDSTVLVSSHVMEDVVDLADTVLVLHDGRLRFQGSLSTLQDLAPTDTDRQRAAEAGFLAVIARAEESAS